MFSAVNGVTHTKSNALATSLAPNVARLAVPMSANTHLGTARSK